LSKVGPRRKQGRAIALLKLIFRNQLREVAAVQVITEALIAEGANVYEGIPGVPRLSPESRVRSQAFGFFQKRKLCTLIMARTQTPRGSLEVVAVFAGKIT
jgi:hypothetical protein